MMNRATPSTPCAHIGCPALAAEGTKCQRHSCTIRVVSGLPASGKSTYIKDHKQDSDLVWDMDVVMTALIGLPRSEKSRDCLGVVIAMREALVAELAYKRPDRDVWIIVTADDQAALVVEQLGAELVRCQVPEAERQRRLSERRGI